VLDEVMLAIYKAPRSYTGEDLVEISCHGSPYIVQELLQLLFDCGARPAREGEFTLRAFLNGKLDLSQAEAVADLIAAESQSSHDLAMQQMRGGYSANLAILRQSVIDFVALLELELDFGEEDVEFAKRAALKDLVIQIRDTIAQLRESFSAGNVLKRGIPVVIAGKPNAGKSTLLNALLQDDRALVSEIAGTTRDTIEEKFVLDGTVFRLIDTAGLRESEDRIEAMGMERTRKELLQAAVVLYLFDLGKSTVEDVKHELLALETGRAHVIPVGTKRDQVPGFNLKDYNSIPGFVGISALNNDTGALLDALRAIPAAYRAANTGLIVSNSRHYQALGAAYAALEETISGLDAGLSGELVVFHLRDAIRHIGSITGVVDNEEVLGSIFSRFCIGK